MYQSEYNAKMNELLSDQSTYAPSNNNPVLKLQSDSNDLVKRLYDESVIDLTSYREMIKYNTHLSKIYALPKVHKPNAPLRPIVSNINSPSCVLAKFMDKILRVLLHDNYDVVNSTVVKERISNIFINRTESLVSFDIVSLFPSIPIDLCLKIIEGKWNLIATNTSMSKELFFDILNFVLVESTYFDFNNNVFKQINGCAMGSSISPTVANIVMNELLDQVIPKLQYKPKLFVKYVDDILAIVPNRQVKNTLDLLNSFHNRIRFTHEIESDNRIPFLDLMVIRDNNSLITDWYRKETSTDMTLNYLSNHPKSMKDSVAYNLFLRATSLSDSCFHKANIEKVYKILEDNNYPKSSINKQLHRVLNKSTSTTAAPAQNIEIPKRRSITYEKSISNVLIRTIRTESNNCVQPTAKPFRQLHTTVFSKLKTKVEPLQRTHCVYKIPCKGNGSTQCDLSYVGQTKNRLTQRLSQHKTSVNTGLDPNGQSAVVTHFLDLGHKPNLEQATILATEEKCSRRLTRESLHIFSEHTYNRRRDTDNIAASYCALLDRQRKIKNISTHPRSH